MKRVLCCLSIVIFILVSGCAGLQLQLTETQEVAGSILARRMGNCLAAEYPDITKRLVPVAQVFVDDMGAAPVLESFISILSEIDDPLLQADVADLSRMIKIKGPMITVDEAESINAIMIAFLQGVKMGGK